MWILILFGKSAVVVCHLLLDLTNSDKRKWSCKPYSSIFFSFVSMTISKFTNSKTWEVGLKSIRPVTPLCAEISIFCLAEGEAKTVWHHLAMFFVNSPSSEIHSWFVSEGRLQRWMYRYQANMSSLSSCLFIDTLCDPPPRPKQPLLERSPSCKSPNCFISLRRNLFLLPQ